LRIVKRGLIISINSIRIACYSGGPTHLGAPQPSDYKLIFFNSSYQYVREIDLTSYLTSCGCKLLISDVKLAALSDGGLILSVETSPMVWIFHSPGVEVDLSAKGITGISSAAGDHFTRDEITVIKLSSFTASATYRKIILSWTTESEIDNAGFNIYRSESKDGEYIKINASLIPAKGSSTQGASYEFIDTNVQNRKTYYYKLEDIDLSGTSTMHGPVSATPRLIYGIGK
jgi:hypothetical protein